MKRDNFLIGILAGILVLVATTTGLYFLRQGSPSYVSDSTPAGVVHDYGLALLNRDYQKAYAYLADKQYKPTYAEFYSQMLNYSSDSFVLDIGATQVNGTEATVDLYFMDTRYGNFMPNPDYAHLVLQNGEWRLDQMNYYLWGYGWYQPQPALVTP